MSGLPIECQESFISEHDSYDRVFVNAVFIKDFGPWKNGTVVKELVLDCYQMHLYEIINNKIVKEIYLKFVPKNS